MRYCTRCEKQIRDYVLFCPYCGTPANEKGVEEKEIEEIKEQNHEKIQTNLLYKQETKYEQNEIPLDANDNVESIIGKQSNNKNKDISLKNNLFLKLNKYKIFFSLYFLWTLLNMFFLSLGWYRDDKDIIIVQKEKLYTFGIFNDVKLSDETNFSSETYFYDFSEFILYVLLIPFILVLIFYLIKRYNKNLKKIFRYVRMYKRK